MFWNGTKFNSIFVRTKIFGPEQNILGPVEGQDISKKVSFLLIRYISKVVQFSIRHSEVYSLTNNIGDQPVILNLFFR